MEVAQTRAAEALVVFDLSVQSLHCPISTWRWSREVIQTCGS